MTFLDFPPKLLLALRRFLQCCITTAPVWCVQLGQKRSWKSISKRRKMNNGPKSNGLLVYLHFRSLLTTCCRRFKLHLKPKTNTTIRVGDQVSMLPPNKSLVEIFADFLEYLFVCSKTFIQETVLPDGPGFWASVENDIKFVLSHPNGWEGAQQSHMRRAAVLAGLVSNDRNDQDRIQFVTEGEASLHFCINSGLTIKVSFMFHQNSPER